MSSAYSITKAVNPPRAVYLDYPLGHTTGKPHDQDNQLEILRTALAAFEQIDAPGEIIEMPFEWRADHSWKDRVMRPREAQAPSNKKEDSEGHADDRVARHDSPQYQSQADADAVTGSCPSCIFLEPTT